MNRWLKYGGILPETINISEIGWTNNYAINAEGRVVATQSARYSDVIYLPKGKYKIKLIANVNISSTILIRIHSYNESLEWIEQITSFRTPVSNVNTIYTQVINIENDSFIRISQGRSYYGLMEIEKL